jgi:7-cyano-7-deazaguanine tRNA-ribosyltransferase
LLEFEVRDTDLAARIGRISINGKLLETPAYLPVLHPVSQELPSQLIKEAGFDAVMTNSYITMKKYPEGVDIHKLTPFDGIIMTDSGGYQALIYGDVDAEPEKIAEYQVRIGSDIAVILDLPTGSIKDKRKAEMTVDKTYSAAKKSLPFMKKPPAWAAPIQGGSFEDLVMLSAKKMSSLPFDMFAIGSPVEFMNNYRYKEVVKLITAAKRVLPVDKPVHLFGAGHPFTIALAVAMGCDMFDSASYILFAKEDKYMMPHGVRQLKELQELPCCCNICKRRSAEELKALPKQNRVQEIALHNLYTIKQEVDMTKAAIREGRLWNYLMFKLRSHPNLYSVLPFPEPMLKMFEEGSSIDKKRAFFFFDRYDLDSPEVRRHRRRLLTNYTKRNDSLMLIIAEDFDRLFMHSEKLLDLGDRSKADVVIFHPFLSVIPVLIMHIYPLVQNVVPSNVGYDVVKDSIDYLSKWVSKMMYRSIILVQLSKQLSYKEHMANFLASMKKKGVKVSQMKFRI